MSLLFNMLGNLGMICFLAAYFFLQKGKLQPNGYPYLGLNFVGSILLMISLSHDWNLPAFMLEAAWALISSYGLIKTYRKRGMA
jgi:hypothetical protein